MAEKVVIIGSGPAGLAAAIYAGRANLQPLLFEGVFSQENYDLGRPPLGQLMITTEIENYPGFPHGDMTKYLDTALSSERRSFAGIHSAKGPSGSELMELMRQQAVNCGARIVGEDVVEVGFGQRPFTLKISNGESVSAHAVIVATGARANYLGLDSEKKFKNRGVSACAVCDGGLPRFKNKPLAVIGGGDSAMEEATYLTKHASKVIVVHRRDKFRASKVMAQRVLDNPKIEVKWNSVVDEVLGDDANGVTGVRLRSALDPERTEVVDVSGYFAAIGHTPNTDFLKGHLAMTDKNYIQWTVPFRTNTSVEGVFAAGDVADDNYRQAITAAGSGCQSALDAERWLSVQGID